MTGKTQGGASDLVCQASLQLCSTCERCEHLVN